jgi:uncharacterized protein (DUF3084 family)
LTELDRLRVQLEQASEEREQVNTVMEQIKREHESSISEADQVVQQFGQMTRERDELRRAALLLQLQQPQEQQLRDEALVVMESEKVSDLTSESSVRVCGSSRSSSQS